MPCKALGSFYLAKINELLLDQCVYVSTHIQGTMVNLVIS